LRYLAEALTISSFERQVLLMEEQNNPTQPEDAASSAQGEFLHANEQADEKRLREESLGGSKYRTETKGDISVQAVGDHHQHFNFFVSGEGSEQIQTQIRGMLSEIMRKPKEEEGIDFSATPFKNATARKVKFESEATQESQPKQEVGAQGKAIPQTDEEIAEWYIILNEYEQCLVQAMAIFAGASIPEVAYAANRLYKSIEDAAKRQSSTQPPGEQQPPPTVKNQLSTLKDRLYLRQRRFAREECLFWQDTDTDGISQFQLRLLNFLAYSAPMWPESIFLSQLRAWADSLEMDDDNAFRATRALGVVLWHYVGTLREIANSWTTKQSKMWYRAATLLYGAYEADCQAFGANANDPAKSPVLQLLGQWVRKARQSGAVNKGCAAALTYTLIGERSLKTAISGLNSLLELPRIKKGNARKQETETSQETGVEITEEVYECVVLGFHELAVSGYLVEIMHYLAHQVEGVAYHRLPLTDMTYTEREYYRVQRQLTLIFALDTFFRIAGTSFHNVKTGQDWVNYSPAKALPSPLSPINRDGREVLLASILLTAESPLYAPLRSLLCAVLIENTGDLRDLGFDLLRQWADFVLKDQSPRPSLVRQAYIQFLVELSQEMQKWSRHTDALGFHASPATVRFQRRLQQWQQEGRRRQLPIETLAQEVLALLSA
jgi:hypothetical protein